MPPRARMACKGVQKHSAKFAPYGGLMRGKSRFHPGETHSRTQIEFNMTASKTGFLGSGAIGSPVSGTAFFLPI